MCAAMFFLPLSKYISESRRSFHSMYTTHCPTLPQCVVRTTICRAAKKEGSHTTLAFSFPLLLSLYTRSDCIYLKYFFRIIFSVKILSVLFVTRKVVAKVVIPFRSRVESKEKSFFYISSVFHIKKKKLLCANFI